MFSFFRSSGKSTRAGTLQSLIKMRVESRNARCDGVDFVLLIHSFTNRVTMKLKCVKERSRLTEPGLVKQRQRRLPVPIRLGHLRDFGVERGDFFAFLGLVEGAAAVADPAGSGAGEAVTGCADCTSVTPKLKRDNNDAWQAVNPLAMVCSRLSVVQFFQSQSA